MFDFFRNIFRAFKTSFKLFFSPKVTLNYPAEKENRGSNARRSHAVDIAKCVACDTCARACPANAISIKFHCDGDKKVLDTFTVDYGKCCFCGICESACHKKAISLSAENKRTFRKSETVKTIGKRRRKK